jgi:methylated-DNA-[protein]-cysteine S-methyltransferase
MLSATIKTRFGPFTMAMDEDSVVRGAVFGDVGRLRQVLPGVKFKSDEEASRMMSRMLRAWFAGSDRFAIRPEGTPFQKRVWDEVQNIPRGTTRTYKEIAARLKTSPRAVGRALGSNPIALLVPCHRVVGAEGGLIGYAFGVGIKKMILEFEKERRLTG